MSALSVTSLSTAAAGILAIGLLLNMARLMRLNRNALALALQAEAEAKASRQLLVDGAEVCFDLFSVYTPVLDEEGNVVDLRFEFANERVGRIFETETQDLVGKSFLSLSDSDFARHMVKALGNVFLTGVPFEIEHLLRKTCGEGRWMRFYAERSGQRVAVAGHDIHERRIAQDALRESEERLMSSLGAIQIGVMLVAPDGSILQANAAALSLLEGPISSIQAVGRSTQFQVYVPWGNVMPYEDRPIERALLGECVQGEEVLLRWSNGHERWLRANAEPLWREGQDTPYAIVSSFQDISVEVQQRLMLDNKLREIAETNVELEAQRFELERANGQLSRLATTDGLTGLANHRTFQERLEKAIAEATSFDAPLSLALIDVDRFKDFNDEFGHQAGDAVLRGVARVLEDSTDHLVARYGGEEFVALLPGLLPGEAFAAAERMREAIAQSNWANGRVTASLGVATLAPGMGREDLIEAADRALYTSKRLGRNQTNFNARIAEPQAT